MLESTIKNYDELPLLLYSIDVKTLASIIGHESVETTLNVCAHSSKQMKRDAAKKIDEAIGAVLWADVTASDASCCNENGEGTGEFTNGANKPKTVEFKPCQPNVASLERVRCIRSAKTCGKGDTLIPSTANASHGTSMIIARKNVKKARGDD